MTLASAGAPSADERLHPPYKIATLVAAAAEEGLAAATLLAGTGLTPAALADPEVRTSSRQFVQACANALAAGASAELPFRMGMRVRASHYGLYGYAMLTCRTVREGMVFAQRFHRLAAPTFRIALTEARGVACWTFGDLLGLAPGTPLHAFLVAFQLALQVSMARDLWPDAMRPDEVLLRHAEPPQAALYPRYLGCPARFGQAIDGARFDATLLDAPLALHNPLTQAMVHGMCERLLLQAAEAGGGTLAQRVTQLLAERPGRFPAMDEVADALHMTERTLRRRLADEGTSFQRVLDGVRTHLAKDYLRNTRMSSDDIAFALGFSDAANFRQAFRKWAGSTPAQFRRLAA